jgi:hypothetical protein
MRKTKISGINTKEHRSNGQSEIYAKVESRQQGGRRRWFHFADANRCQKRPHETKKAATSVNLAERSGYVEKTNLIQRKNENAQSLPRKGW